uniref:Uncharacterized protein n=1 Tax=Nothoprocta perdicaria TaxID=30464 RepID=A0A8C6ZCG9_NOTPE
SSPSVFLPISRLLARSLLTCDSAMSARSSASSSSCWILRNFLLDLLLASFQCQLLSLIQTVLQVLHRLLQVLLHPLQVGTRVLLLLQLFCHHGCLQSKGSEGIVPAPDLSIQGALHGLHNTKVVPLQLVDFLIFFCNFPVNFRLDLVQLKLDANNLPLFMFQGSLKMGK